jgi:thioredoxin reductase (NADPH)
MLRLIFLAVSFCCFAEEQVQPVVIIGGGIGALTSALYLGRAEMQPVVLEGKTPGGLLTQSHSVQNWPGVMEIKGHVLVEQMREQAIANGAVIYPEEVIAVDFSSKPFTIQTQSTDGRKKVRTLKAETCIIAMGTQPNYLGIPGEKKYWGHGVTNCAVCDGNLYQGKKVGVVGGGDAAVLEALYLSNIASEVTVFVRKDKLRAGEKKRIHNLLSKSNIQIMYDTQVSEIKGDKDSVRSVVIQSQGKKIEVPLDGLFLAIGSTPNSRIFQNQIALDSKGYILVREGGKTSVPGVYAVGDIVDPVFKQAVTASGDAAKAALEVQQYLSDQSILVAKPCEKKSNVASPSTVIEIQSQDQFEKELALSDTPVIVDFYATWCGPCNKIAPLIEESASRLNGKIKFLKVNVDKIQNLSQTYEIRSMPTVLLMDSKGAVIDRQVGLEPIYDLLDGLLKKKNN